MHIEDLNKAQTIKLIQITKAVAAQKGDAMWGGVLRDRPQFAFDMGEGPAVFGSFLKSDDDVYEISAAVEGDADLEEIISMDNPLVCYREDVRNWAEAAAEFKKALQERLKDFA